MVILIPAYQPDGRLVELVVDLIVGARPRAQSASNSLTLNERDDLLDKPSVVIVDDGSGPAFESVFEAARLLGAHVIVHARNLGKGMALKTGFAYIAAAHPGQGVVCADSDGQHCGADVDAVFTRLDQSGNASVAPQLPVHQIVLGSRSFTGAIPWKSKVGNDFTRTLFRFATGSPLRDTQTGLRAYSADLLPWLATIPGSRFEYELNVLLAATQSGFPLIEEPIRTIYLDGNASTHFDPLRDSIRIYVPLLGFALRSVRRRLGPGSGRWGAARAA